jgi:hypothetical protein
MRTGILVGLLGVAGCGTQTDSGIDFADGSGDGDTSDSMDGSESQSGTQDGTQGDGDGDDDGVPKFDLGSDPDIGQGECGCGSELEFSYIWIANSQQGTVSRVNTKDVTEEGRYLTRPDGAGNPSRTSVSLSGRAVAVANRSGGVVKIWSQADLCDPMKNGQPGLQTSDGKDDVLDWGDDDCVAWYSPFDDSNSQRPIAWIAGEQDLETCEYHDEQLWTARSGQDGVFAHLLNGEDGSEAAKVPTGMNGGMFGQYGGAVDSKGDFWITVNGILGPPNLAVVHHDDLTVEHYEFPDGIAAYGITVDSQDRVWLSANGYGVGVSSFDPATDTWTKGNGGFTSFAGVVETADHRIWTGSQDGTLYWFNGDDATVGQGLLLDSMIKGVSVDMEGFVWAVTGTTAFKVDPDNLQVVGSYDGLDGPYTYSDMTGWALQNAACKPEG